MSLSIRPACPDDAPALAALEQACFEDTPWQTADFLRHNCLVAIVEGQVAGFVVAHKVFAGLGDEPNEYEILNLAVHPERRRQGIAKALLKKVVSTDNTYFLEVRESNSAARALYTQLGFAQIGTRPGYYQSPAESALVMQIKGC